MEYNRKVTEEHPLASYIKNINTLAKDDGGVGVFDNDVVAISLDHAEKSLGKAIHNRTMDVAIGVIKKGTSQNRKGEKMILCEFRFNYKKPKNIKNSEIREKINYSKTLIQNGYLGSVYDIYYLLFSSNVLPEARNHISRIMNGRLKGIEIMTELDFKNLLWDND